MLRCPSKSWITRISTPCSRRWVAKLCRSVCGVTLASRPARSAASRNARWTDRSVIHRVADDAVFGALAVVLEREVGLQTIATRRDVELDVLRERSGLAVCSR